MELNSSQTHRLIRLPAVMKKTGMSAATIYRSMEDDKFPRHVVVGPNMRAWLEEEIDRWITARVDDRDTGADRELRAVNPNIGKGRPKRDRLHRGSTVDVA
jgi:prophage regulatory protein